MCAHLTIIIFFVGVGEGGIRGRGRERGDGTGNVKMFANHWSATNNERQLARLGVFAGVYVTHYVYYVYAQLCLVLFADYLNLTVPQFIFYCACFRPRPRPIQVNRNGLKPTVVIHSLCSGYEYYGKGAAYDTLLLALQHPPPSPALPLKMHQLKSINEFMSEREREPTQIYVD